MADLLERPETWAGDPNRRYEYSEIEVEWDGVPVIAFAVVDNMDPDNDLGFVTKREVARLVTEYLNARD